MKEKVLLRIACAVLLALGVAAVSSGQDDPVKWSASSRAKKVAPGQPFAVELIAHIEEGWHLYSLDQPPPPIATKIMVPAGQLFVLAGAVDAPAAESAFDPSFGINTEFYAQTATFTLPMKVAADAPGGARRLAVQARFQTCNDQFCLPPKTVTVEVPIEVEASAGASGAGGTGMPAVAASPAPAVSPGPGAPSSPASAPASGGAKVRPPAAPGRVEAVAFSTPPAAETSAPAVHPATSSAPDMGHGSGSPATTSAAHAADAALAGDLAADGGGPQSLWAFIWLAMTVGALSLLTPCVFPMVPITVSYFTNHAAGSRAKSVQQAVTYMVGIILTFTALGMALALLVGATSLNRFAANPWINLLITGSSSRSP